MVICNIKTGFIKLVLKKVLFRNRYQSQGMDIGKKKKKMLGYPALHLCNIYNITDVHLETKQWH